MNKFPIIEFHILQSFPVSCLNRDDTNSPKTCVIGGIERARVSSQCWKRSVRLSLRDFDIKLGIRTKKVAEGIEKSLKDKGCAEEAVIKSAQEVSKLIAEDSLTFFTDKEYEAIADLLLDKKSVKIGDISKVIKKGKIQVLNGLDIALFGRMVAKAPSMNVEAAASFSHAISTHAVAPEMDFFTAIDDCKVNNEDESGAAHMGVSEYSSATYYRYSFPRVCGDVSFTVIMFKLQRTLSPRMRGCFWRRRPSCIKRPGFPRVCGDVSLRIDPT